jgi:hypothetical protein
MAKTTVKKKNTSSIQLTDNQIIMGVTGLLTGAIIAIVAFIFIRQNIPVDGVQLFPDLPAGHSTTTVNYPMTPPAGGPHHPVWQTCGVYSEPIINEHAVHSLEHGAIWITYRPDLPADQIEQLANLTRQSTHRLLSPFPGLDSPIVLSAWGAQLKVNDPNDGRIGSFITRFEQGPTTPERGASCSGGETRTVAQIRPS